MKYALLSLLTVFALSLTGCGMLGGGKTIVKYENTPIETKAPQSGTYALYSPGDYNPRVRTQVKEGENIGFRKSQTGQVFAFVGDKEFPLETGSTYYWKRE